MHCTDITLCLCLLVVVCCRAGVSGKKVTTYDELSRLIMNGITWGNKPAVEATTKCDRSQCDQVKQLCNNGGTCYVTDDCGIKCACPTGFTGFFCGVKVPDLVTTIAMDIAMAHTEKTNKNKGILSKILSKQVAPTDVLSGTETPLTLPAKSTTTSSTPTSSIVPASAT